jgi:ribulose-5-phosphate 4-epimerase/fuculose-1-phosphate aldolase
MSHAAAPAPASAIPLPPCPAHFHPDEWAARQELAACYRVFAMLGWVEMIYNHITLRVPVSVSGAEKHFLINPFGLHYTEVTASNLVKINLKGEVVDGSAQRVNPAGFVVHSAIHAALDQAHCVMHTHTTAGLAFTAPNCMAWWPITTLKASPCMPTRARACLKTWASNRC